MQSTRLLNPRRFLTLRDPQLEALDLSGALGEGSPPAAAYIYLDRQPGISGRIGEADSAQPTRDGPSHGRLGFWPGRGPYFAAVMRMHARCATHVLVNLALVVPLLLVEEPLTHFTFIGGLNLEI